MVKHHPIQFSKWKFGDFLWASAIFRQPEWFWSGKCTKRVSKHPSWKLFHHTIVTGNIMEYQSRIRKYIFRPLDDLGPQKCNLHFGNKTLMSQKRPRGSNKAVSAVGMTLTLQQRAHSPQAVGMKEYKTPNFHKGLQNTSNCANSRCSFGAEAPWISHWLDLDWSNVAPFSISLSIVWEIMDIGSTPIHI